MSLKSPALLLFLIIGLLASCEQYNPFGFWDLLKRERIAANNNPPPKLTKDGKIPVVKVAEELSPIDRKYKVLCASCHDISGNGDTPLAKSMVYKPRNFTDPVWQSMRTDAQIRKVIQVGGAGISERLDFIDANGKKVNRKTSPLMVGWEAQLPGDLLDEMVQKVRSFSTAN